MKLGQGNIFRSICQEFCSLEGGVACPIACWDTPPRDQTPPGPEEDTPWGPDTLRDQTPPPPTTQCMLGDTGNKWAVRILLESNLVNCGLPHNISCTAIPLLGPVYTKRQRQRCNHSVMILTTLFSLKSIETLENGLQTLSWVSLQELSQRWRWRLV